MFHYIRYDSVFFQDNILSYTILGNTMTTKYNFIFHFYNQSNTEIKDNYKYLYLDCSDKKIGKFIFGFTFHMEESKISKMYNY